MRRGAGEEKHGPVESPLTANSIAEEGRVSTGGYAVDLVVRAHDAGHPALHYACLEGHIVRVLYVLLTYLHRIPYWIR